MATKSKQQIGSAVKAYSNLSEAELDAKLAELNFVDADDIKAVKDGIAAKAEGAADPEKGSKAVKVAKGLDLYNEVRLQKIDGKLREGATVRKNIKLSADRAERLNSHEDTTLVRYVKQ